LTHLGGIEATYALLVVDDGTTLDGGNQPPGRTRRVASWTPPEIVAVTFLSVAVFYVAGVVSYASGLSGWRDQTVRWTDWALQPWLPVLMLAACLIAWYLVTGARRELYDAGDSLDEVLVGAAADERSRTIAELWNRFGRAHVIAVVAAAFAAVNLIAAVLFVMAAVWPQSNAQLIDPYHSILATVTAGLACILPAVATVVVFSFVHDVWRDLRYGDEGEDIDADFADSAAEGRLPSSDSPND
jgi:hypothetical protein